MTKIFKWKDSCDSMALLMTAALWLRACNRCPRQCHASRDRNSLFLSGHRDATRDLRMSTIVHDFFLLSIRTHEAKDSHVFSGIRNTYVSGKSSIRFVFQISALTHISYSQRLFIWRIRYHFIEMSSIKDVDYNPYLETYVQSVSWLRTAYCQKRLRIQDIFYKCKEQQNTTMTPQFDRRTNRRMIGMSGVNHIIEAM